MARKPRGSFTPSNEQFDMSDQAVEGETRECERCGETYVTLKLLADLGRDRCPACADIGPDGFDAGVKLGTERQPSNHPLMEYGPLSLTDGGTR